MRLQLMPREEKFFDNLEILNHQGEDAIRAMSGILSCLADGTDPHHFVFAMQKTRMEAKAVRDSLSAALCNTFITPLDREDIQALSLALYKIVKKLHKFQERVLIYQIPPRDGDLSRQLLVVEQAAKTLTEMVDALRHAKNAPAIDDKNRIVEDAENEADALFNELITTLYRNASADPVDMMKRRDLYDLMEKVIDLQRDASHIILEIFLKHT